METSTIGLAQDKYRCGLFRWNQNRQSSCSVQRPQWKRLGRNSYQNHSTINSVSRSTSS
ncbi:hypothetical protein AHAS_Ahas07G0135000 [Arachis hypogaea]